MCIVLLSKIIKCNIIKLLIARTSIQFQMLRSRCNDSQNIAQPSQNISIVVSDPQRTRQGLSMIISYTINTVVRQDRRYISGPNDEENMKEYTVTRNHSNVTALYNCLIREYRKSGVIVPPPPKGLSKVLTLFNFLI